MRPLIVHASSKAHNDKPRRVLHIEYSTPDALRMVWNWRSPEPTQSRLVAKRV